MSLESSPEQARLFRLITAAEEQADQFCRRYGPYVPPVDDVTSLWIVFEDAVRNIFRYRKDGIQTDFKLCAQLRYALRGSVQVTEAYPSSVILRSYSRNIREALGLINALYCKNESQVDILLRENSAGGRVRIAA